MRKLALILSFAIGICASCATIKPLSTADIPAISTPMQLMYWVHDNIEYVSNPKRVDQAQRPEETLELRKGNCVDQATLFLYLVETKEHINGRVVILRSVDEKLSGHPVGAGHLVVALDGYVGLYDPTEGQVDFHIPEGCVVSTN